MAGESGGSWWNPIDNIQAQASNYLGGGAIAASGTYDNSSYTPSYQQQPTQQSSPQVQGASTDGGSYYDSAKGYFVDQNGNRIYASDSPTTSPTYSNYSSGGGGSAAPAYDANDMKILDSQYGRYQTLLDGLDPALASGLKNLGESETQANTNATQQNNRATRDFNTSELNSRNSKNQAINSVDTNARTMSDSLRRIIGMAGGSGASANLAGSNAVARQASQQRDGVMGSYGKNEQALQTARDDTQTDFEKLLAEIKRSRNTQEQALRGGIIDQRNNFNSTMADIDLERTSLRGGDPLAAMQPYTDRFNTNQAELQALPEKYRNIASRDVSVSKPALADYLVDKQALNASNQNGGQQQYSPYKAFLDKNKEEELA